MKLFLCTILLLAAPLARAQPGQTSKSPQPEQDEQPATLVAHALRHEAARLGFRRDDWENERPRRIVSESLARLGQWKDALRAAPDALAREQATRLVARSVAQSGQPERAEQIAARIADRSLRLDALLAVARAHLNVNQAAEARQVLQRTAPLLRTARGEYAAGYFIQAAFLLAKSGDASGARRWFSQAQKLLDPLRTRPDPSDISGGWQAASDRKDLARRRIEVGMVSEALSFVLPEQRLGGENWLGLTQALARNGHFDEAKSFLLSRVPLMRSISLWLEIAAEQKKRGLHAEAHQSAAQGRALFDALPAEARAARQSLLLPVALLHALGDERDKALQVFSTPPSTTPTSSSQPRRYNPDEMRAMFLLAVALNPELQSVDVSRERDIEAAIQALPQIRERGEKERRRLRLDLAREQFKIGAAEAARGAVRDLARPLLDGSLKGDTTEILSLAREARAMDVPEWRGLVSLFQRQSASVAANTRAGMASSLAAYGFGEEALKALLEARREPLIQSNFYDGIARWLAPQVGVARTLKWAQALRAPIERADALRGLSLFVAPRVDENILHGTGI